MSMNPNQAPRSGLLGLLDRVRRPDEETGLNFANRLGMAASVLNPMNPQSANYRQQMMQSGQARMQGQARNRTIAELQKRADAGDQVAARYLQAVQSRALDASQGFSGYLGEVQANERLRQTEAAANARAMLAAGKVKQPSKVQAYEYAVNQLGMTQEEALKFANSGQTINLGGAAGAEDEFFKKKYERLGTEFAKIQQKAGQAGANNLTINALKQLYQVAPNGPITGRLLELFPEATDVSAAVQSLRTQLAPQLRVEGSGSTSDIEYAGMLNSLGSLKNSPQANAALLDLMLAKNEIIQRKAEIASKVGLPEDQGGLTIQNAEKAMLDVDRQMWEQNATVASIKKLIVDAGGFTATSDGKTITTSGGLTVEFGK